MDFKNYEDWLYPELVVLVPVLYGLGLVLKHLEFIKDKYIPLILTGVSVALSCLYILANDGISAKNAFAGVTQGIISVAAAVYGHQLYKQSTK